MTKNDIDKFLASLVNTGKISLETALNAQEQLYNDQTIVRVEPSDDSKNSKPQTIKFNEPMTNAKKRCFSDMLFNDVRYKSIDFDKIDIEKMVEEYKEGILISQSLTYDDLLVRAIAYKKGLEDMLKLIKEGGSNESID